MRYHHTLFLALAFLAACHSPKYFVQKGDYDKAVEQYSSKLRSQKKGKKNKSDLLGLEMAFALAHKRDSGQLNLLFANRSIETWPRINTVHRQIQTRQKTVSALLPLRSKKGYVPKFSMVESIDSLQDNSRKQAAAYLYAHAQNLLALTDSTGQRQPARDAYYALRDLKSNYFSYWENTVQLIDSAYRAGKAHVLFEPGVQSGVPSGNTFWGNTSFGGSFPKHEWLVFYADSSTRAAFDFRAKCHLVSLYVSPESTSSSERTESKQVEDGYEEKRDSAGHVISRTQKYKTEITTITTYQASRSANGTVLLELHDERTGQIVHSQALHGVYNFEERSEQSRVSAPSEWSMIDRVADDVRGSMYYHLKKALVPTR